MPTSRPAGDGETERMSLARWLKALPKPCGIFASFDQRAKHVLDVCREIGLAVPQQVQVISVDNEVSICEQTVPALTSIAPDFERPRLRKRRLCGGDRARPAPQGKETAAEMRQDALPDTGNRRTCLDDRPHRRR